MSVATAEATGEKIAAKERIKVLLILHELSITGAPKSVLEYFERMRDGIEVRIIALRSGDMLTQALSLGPVYHAYPPQMTRLGEFPRFVRTALAQKTWAERWERWKPDLIYANSVASLPVLEQFPLPKVPVLLHLHELEMLLSWYQRRSKSLSTWPDRYIAVSEAVRAALIEGYKIEPERITVVNACLDEKMLASLPKRNAKFKRPVKDVGRFVVGGAGRIQWRKGFELWLQTAAELTALLGSEAVRFVWVGGEDDMHEQEFRTISRKLGVEEIVEIVPMTPDPLWQYMRFDAFAMTSWEDPFPAVVLETMALKTPTVCVAGGGGAAEQIGETGIVVPRFDAREMAEGLAQLARDPERRRQMGEAAHERALTNFRASVQTPKLWREIQRLAGRPV